MISNTRAGAPPLKIRSPGANHGGLSEQCSDAAFKDKAVFVLAVVSVYGSCQDTRRHRVFDEREAFLGVSSFNEKSCTNAS